MENKSQMKKSDCQFFLKPALFWQKTENKITKLEEAFCVFAKRKMAKCSLFREKSLNLEMGYHTKHQVLTHKWVVYSKIHVERANNQVLLKG